MPDVMAKNRMTADVVDSASWDLQLGPMCLSDTCPCSAHAIPDLTMIVVPQQRYAHGDSTAAPLCATGQCDFGSVGANHCRCKGLHMQEWVAQQKRCGCEHLMQRQGAAHQKLKLEMRCRAAPVASVSTGSSGPLLKGACGVPTCWICAEQ